MIFEQKGMMHMQCEEFLALIEEYLKSGKGETFRSEFREHANNCESCSRALERAEVSWEAVRSGWPVGLDEADSEEPVIRIACTILQQAILEGAGEVHVSLAEQSLNVTFRAGDELAEKMDLPRYLSIPLSECFLSMAGLDASSREPQMGEIHVRWNHIQHNLRLSATPNELGDDLVFSFI